MVDMPPALISSPPADKGNQGQGSGPPLGVHLCSLGSIDWVEHRHAVISSRKLKLGCCKIGLCLAIVLSVLCGSDSICLLSALDEGPPIKKYSRCGSPSSVALKRVWSRHSLRGRGGRLSYRHAKWKPGLTF